ncbi:hypothetical protein FQN53_005522 [Emmonsiellopsis sp. PD_33]|nr:hypothetical protein FQN53_005522 [Emmonsiellopsis sp. PD_33]KAK2803949.1 hypothetical protein FQN51_002836 [Onygenales sp. PD_10]
MAELSGREKMLRGELYHAFTPELIAARKRCRLACDNFNRNAAEASVRRKVELWRDIIEDPTPLPPVLSDPAADEAQFEDDPWIDEPIRMDYGFNVKVGKGAYINSNCVIIDTCLVTIGARTLFGPSVNLYSGTHPLDPALRNGIKGPELGKEIHIGEDCWIGGNVTIVPGVTIGKGATVGAGSVVTKDVPAFHVVAGNPAKIIRRIETSMTETSEAEGQQ